MSTEQAIRFTANGLQLASILHLPESEPSAVVVGCHGLMADKHSPKQIELAQKCTDIGMAYFRFDHRGCGESEGVFEDDTTLENRRADLLAAVGTVGDRVGRDLPIGFFGSSLGGTVCLSAAGHFSPFAIVTLATPVQSQAIQMPEDSPQALKNELIENRLVFDVTASMGRIHHVLIIHGSADETVPVTNADRIYQMADDPKRRLILNGADHRISNTAHQRRFIRETVKWLVECLKKTVLPH